PIIFPTQLTRYIHHLNHTPTQLTPMHHKLAEQLSHRHISSSRHTRLPKYKYENLKKGIVCKSCRGFMYACSVYKLQCRNCGDIQKMETGIMCIVIQYYKLLPKRKINTSTIND